ncbi:MAG: glycoside hydrolase family 5 protein [Ruminococcus sp.]|nr:glycoside hydrolase family 5 protein [Ruminococcus sp.]
MKKLRKLLSIACSLSLLTGMAAGMSGCSSGSQEGSGDSGSSGASDTAKKSDDVISLASIADTLGAGWNYGNTMEANSGGTPDETVWGNPAVSQEMMNAVAGAGFKTVRVPVSYLDRIDDANGYKVDEEWLSRVEEVVGYAYNAGLNVIINVHGDGYNSIYGGWLLCNGSDQDYIKEKYAALWKQIAERFSDYDEHLIFESMNEEFDGEYHDPVREYYENINAYNQIFVDTVRAAGGDNTHRWLMMPGWNTDINYTVGDYGFEMPEDNDNTAGEGRMILSVHCYDPWDYCGEEGKKTFLWGKKGEEIVEVNKASPKWCASWGKEDHIEGQMKKLKDNFVDKGIPVIIGEYGCIDKTDANAGIPNQIAENRVYYDAFLAGTAAKNGITPVYWDNGYNGQYGFGLFNRNTVEQTQPEIIEGIVKAVADKNPEAGLDIKVKRYTSSSSKRTSGNMYIGIQTKVYTFRNACNDGTYGVNSDYFNTLIKWEDTDGDGSDDITDAGAVFTDAEVKEDGTYTVGVSGYDFSADSEGLNMLFVSTDFEYSTALRVYDVKLICDGTEIPVDRPVVSEDSDGNLYIELVNIYNTEAPDIEYTMPKDSFEITMTLEGVKNVIK